MQDIINKIIEIEKSSRNITEPAIKQKEDLEYEINSEVEKLKTDLYERAHLRIDKIMNAEKKNYESNLEKVNSEFKNSGQILEHKYTENKDIWVNDLYNRILGR
ncbi:hypothetical protein SDC9_125054 [bioreactor metagenome]|uniref:Uncharacterized protein n=1 Tax=bioreactor metagenome TaxID=1076179 RepID=A0A645CMD3_9ZZZZ